MADKVTKAELVSAVFENTGIEKKTIQQVVDSFLMNSKEYMKKGSPIELRGFGTFEIRVRKGREKARNPKTGETVSVPSHCTAVFRPGRELKDALMQLPVD